MMAQFRGFAARLKRIDRDRLIAWLPVAITFIGLLVFVLVARGPRP